MFTSYVGWPSTATRPDCVGRNGSAPIGESHCFTEMGSVKPKAIRYFHWLSDPCVELEQRMLDRHQTPNDFSGNVNMCILP